MGPKDPDLPRYGELIKGHSFVGAELATGVAAVGQGGAGGRDLHDLASKPQAGGNLRGTHPLFSKRKGD